MLGNIILKDIKDCEKFVEITSQIPGRIELYSRDGTGAVYSGKSLLGVIAAMEQEQGKLSIISDRDISKEIAEFLI